MQPKARKLALVAIPALLTGCSNAEDFTVASSKSSAQIVSALGHFNFAFEASFLPNLAIATQRPEENVIVYTIPARAIPNEQTGESEIRLTLERDSKGGTVIHAAVDVPAVRMLMGEANKELSEAKVEAELKKSLTRFQPGEVRQLLVAVAIASNIDYQAMANTSRFPGADALSLSDGDWGTGNEEAGSFAQVEPFDPESTDFSAESGAGQAEDWGN